jgi:hypothetical protein
MRRKRKGYYSNDIAALIPSFWANESLAILEENMVMGNLVHKDFSPIVANLGDTVKTRRPGELTAYRKWHNDDVTIQDVTSTNVDVKLNQHVHVSFLIRDGELSLSMKDLVELYMKPAMLANARFLDRSIYATLLPPALVNAVGYVGGLTGQGVKDGIIDTRTKMNNNKAYMENRNFVITANTDGAMLKPEFFTSAEKVGDQGTALRTASLGNKFGFEFFMSQNASSVPSGGWTTSAGAINLAAGYAAGTTSALVVDGITGAWTTGSWVSIGGVPYQITAHTETSGNTTGITLDRPLLAAVANDAVVTRYTPGAVNLVAGYGVGAYAVITFDGFAGTKPQVGQIVSFGTDTTYRYVVIDATTTTITLDRPLEAAVANDDALNIAPYGEYNMAFHPNSMTLVTRPLAMPMAGAGAQSAIVNYNGLSMRATIAYLAQKQGHLVTLDFLFGTKVLDTDLAAVLLA